MMASRPPHGVLRWLALALALAAGLWAYWTAGAVLPRAPHGASHLSAPGLSRQAAPAGRVTVTQVMVKVLLGRVQVRIEATGPVRYHTRTLSDPDRVVVDIPGAINGVAGGTLPVHQGPVQQIRISQFTAVPPAVRVVIDLARPVKYEASAPRPTTVVIGFLSPASQPAVPAEPVGRPNPFVALVVPSSPAHAPALPLPPGFGSAGGPESEAGDMSLSGIVWTRPQVAIIVAGGRSYVAGVGDRVGEAVVEDIQEGRVILRTDQTMFELHLGGEHAP